MTARKTPLFATRGKCTVHYQPICLVLARNEMWMETKNSLWSLVYDSSALRKDQSSRDRREFGAKTASIFVWNSSDFKWNKFRRNYVFNLIFKLLERVLYSTLKIRLWSFPVRSNFVNWNLLFLSFLFFDEFNRCRNTKYNKNFRFFETFSTLFRKLT